MKTSYEVRAKKFIQQIAEYLKNCYMPDDFERAIKRYNEAKKRHVRVESGACRVVLITSDYVVKIDYNPTKIQYFGGCEDECEFYRRAEDDGYEYLFAKITKFVCHGRAFYIMPRIGGIGLDKMTNWSIDEEEYVYNNVEDLHEWNIGYKNNIGIVIDYACNEYMRHSS